jgi:hypothetical protein
MTPGEVNPKMPLRFMLIPEDIQFLFCIVMNKATTTLHLYTPQADCICSLFKLPQPNSQQIVSHLVVQFCQ